jgi:hypothetical protein
MPPCVIFEDDHLLVVNKPAGFNTHAPSPCAGEGIYEWLKHREPRWAALAIIHRLDKETSGVMVFGKTQTANRSLTEQFTRHTIRKEYRLLTDRPISSGAMTVVSCLVRAGEKYVSRPLHAGGERADAPDSRACCGAGFSHSRRHAVRWEPGAAGVSACGEVDAEASDDRAGNELQRARGLRGGRAGCLAGRVD